jgi:hypothetical protein
MLRPNGSYFSFSYLSPQDVLWIANKCSPTLTQIGCANHVWQVSLVQTTFLANFTGKQVEREATQVGENKMTLKELAPHDRSEVPDIFRVV